MGNIFNANMKLLQLVCLLFILPITPLGYWTRRRRIFASKSAASIKMCLRQETTEEVEKNHHILSERLNHMDYKEDCCVFICFKHNINSQVTWQYLELLHVVAHGKERSVEFSRKKQEVAFCLALGFFIIIINGLQKLKFTCVLLFLFG